MFNITAGILLVVFVPLVVIGNVKLFLSILDYARRVRPESLRRIQ